MVADGGLKKIWSGSGCCVIAEAGVNHNGDPALAAELVDIAAEAGADAVKFQTFNPDQLVSASAPKARYQLATTDREQSQRDMLASLVLPLGAYQSLWERARSRGLLFLSTPFDAGSAEFLVSLGVPALKVPSGEITNHPLLRRLAAMGVPLLVSTGMSDMPEVAAAVAVIRGGGDPPLALLHCVSNYPASPASSNLRAMETMRERFGVPVGWSDHTEGYTISVAAAARGAALVEKHFTIDRTMPGPDHAASLEPDELGAMVAEIRLVETALGDGEKRPVPEELDTAVVARRSLHAARDLAEGEVVRAEDLEALRPGTGISPADLPLVLGRALRVPVPAGTMLSGDHLG